MKIDADVRAETLILEALAREAPFPVISEEKGRVAGEGAMMWAVDPLDGSVNYLRGYPHCAVSIALIKDGAPVLGVVDCFLLDERFAGLVGQGATLNKQPIQVSDIAEPAKGILQTGIPSAMNGESFAAFETRLKQWRKVRMIGSAATALAYVAAGRAEAYRESGSKIWDVAGGLAIVSAAGGETRVGSADFDKPLEVAAGNGKVPLPD